MLLSFVSFGIRRTRAPVNALIRGPIRGTGRCDSFSSKRSFHPLIAWSVGGKIIVRFSAWLLGRVVSISILRKANNQANLTLSDRIKNPFRRLAAALTSKTFAFVITSASVTSSAIYYTNLEEVPVTGRQRFNLIRSEMLDQISEGAALQLKEGRKGPMLSADHAAHLRVQHICHRLIAGLDGIPELKQQAQARTRTLVSPEYKDQ